MQGGGWFWEGLLSRKGTGFWGPDKSSFSKVGGSIFILREILGIGVSFGGLKWIWTSGQCWLCAPDQHTVIPSVSSHLLPACILSTVSGDKRAVGLPQLGADLSPSPSLSLRCHSARLSMPMMLRTQTNSASMPMTLSILSKKVSAWLAGWLGQPPEEHLVTLL